MVRTWSEYLHFMPPANVSVAEKAASTPFVQVVMQTCSQSSALLDSNQKLPLLLVKLEDELKSSMLYPDAEQFWHDAMPNFVFLSCGTKPSFQALRAGTK